MKKIKIEFILISCCTCKRPNMLRESLESVKGLILPENVNIELLVIDNDKNASSKEIIENIKENFFIKINYFVEEKRGISNARNRLLKEALNLGASHIALFDDDEILDQNWLISHYSYYNSNSNAIIVSGPTYNTFKKSYSGYIKKNNIFKSSTTKKTGLVRNVCASGNVFFPTTVMSEAGIFFNPDYVFMGGEDGDFFSRASSAGFTIVWNNEAINRELVNDERANIKWILNRSYYNGYSGAYFKLKQKNSLIRKLMMVLKTSFVLLLNSVLLPFSLLLGLTMFFNVLGIVCKTKGKLDAVIAGLPLNYYENICGN